MRRIAEALREPKVWFVIYLALWLCVNILTLTWWPQWDSNGDESLHASCAMGIWKYGAVRSEMLPGSYLGQYGYGMLSGWIYYGILALFLKVFGVQLFWARMVSLLSGAFALWFTYMTAKELGSARAGFLAALLTGGMEVVGYVSRYTRTDATLMGFVALSLLIFVMAIKRDRASLFLISGFVGTIAFLVRPLNLFLIPAILALLLLYRRWRGALWFTVGVAAATCIILFTNYLPYRTYPILRDIDQPNSRVVPILLLHMRLRDVLVVIKDHLVVWARFFAVPRLWPVMGLFNLCLIGTVLCAFLERKNILPLLFAAMFLSSLVTWPGIRYEYAALFAPVLALGCAFAFVRWRRLFLIAAAVGIGFGAYQFSEIVRGDRNARLFSICRDISSAIPRGSVVIGNWSWFWWPTYGLARYIYLHGMYEALGPGSLSDLASEFGADFVIIGYVRNPPGSPWLRCLSLEEKDLRYLSTLERVKAYPARGIVQLGQADSIVIYRVKR